MSQKIDFSAPRDEIIRKLIYRSSYTGTKETDNILGAFAREILPLMSNDELEHYAALFDYSDGLIWSWLSGQKTIPHDLDNPAIDRLLSWYGERQQHD